MKYLLGESLMKNITKLLNLLTAFLAAIGLCAATLVCFIVVYTQMTGGFSPKRTTDQNVIATQTDTNTIGTFSFSMDQNEDPMPENLSDTNLSNNLNEPEALSLTTDQVSDMNNDVPVEYASALSKAINYSDVMYMSKAGIYDQLVSEYGEAFSPEAAQYAIDNMTADWNSNALQKAENYSDTMYMSKAAIYDQLVSEYGEKFTPSEAQYAIDNLVADWNYNALQKARNYQNTMNMSADAIHEQLLSEYGEKFTSSEADYAVSNIGGNNASNSILYTMPVEQESSSSNLITGSSNENNFNTYNNPDQQQTADMFVLNTSTFKIHWPNCNDVKKIAPENYSTSNLSISELENQGYSTCGHCFG